MPSKNSFDFKAWYNQIIAERQRMEADLARVHRLTDVLASFMAEQEAQNPFNGFTPPSEMESEFEQLTTINKKIHLLYFLLDVIREFSSETDANRRFTMVSDRAAQLVDADRSVLFILDNSTNELVAKLPESHPSKDQRFRRDLGLVGYAASTGRTINITDTSKDQNFNSEIDEKPAYQARNLLITPLRDTGGNIFGVLEVLNKNEGRFTPDDEYLLQAFAAQAAMTLKSTPPGAGAPPLVSNPILLIMKALSGGLGIDNLLQSLMKKTTQVMNADRSTLFLIDQDRQELWSKVAEGTGISEIRFPMNLGIAGHVVTHQETVNIPDAYQDSRFNPEIDARTGYHTRTVLCAPLKDEANKVIGVLQVLNKKEGKFTGQDEQLINTFAGQVSKVVKSSQLVLNLLSMLEGERALAK